MSASRVVASVAGAAVVLGTAGCIVSVKGGATGFRHDYPAKTTHHRFVIENTSQEPMTVRVEIVDSQGIAESASTRLGPGGVYKKYVEKLPGHDRICITVTDASGEVIDDWTLSGKGHIDFQVETGDLLSGN